MALVIDPKVACATSKIFAARLLRFLVGDTTAAMVPLPNIPAGGTWSLLRACDAGSVNEVPADAHDVDSLPTAGNAWKSVDGASLADGDWFVVESASGTCGHVFQLFVQYNSGSCKFKLLPLADKGGAGGAWTYTGTSSALATIFGTPPTGVVPSAAAVSDCTVYAGPANYSTWVDSTTLAVLVDDGATSYWFYVGELNNPRALDVRPFCISNALRSSYVYIYRQAESFLRLSPVDDATVMYGTWAYFNIYNGGGSYDIHTANGDTSARSQYTVLPVGIFFYGTEPHLLYPKYVYSASNQLATAGTLYSLGYVYRRSSASYAALAMTWDGATSYP